MEELGRGESGHVGEFTMEGCASFEHTCCETKQFRGPTSAKMPILQSDDQHNSFVCEKSARTRVTL